MHRRPASLDDARDLARAVFLARQGRRTAPAAIAKLGARREGVLRRHMKREDGSFRGTVVYSVLKDEWPDAKARLAARLTP